MKRTVIIALLCLVAVAASAQRISYRFDNVSMPQALLLLNKMQHDYTISFIYDELEDFKVTKTVNAKNVPDAIRQLIGFYPIKLTQDGKHLFVECTHKTARHYEGLLVDEAGHPVEYANVTLLSPRDSSFMGGGVTNEAGIFVIPSDADRAILRATCIGFNPAYMTSSIGNVGTIQIRTNSVVLNNVTVTGNRPQTTLQGDAMVTNVSGTLLEKSVDMNALLDQLPNVSVTDGKIVVFGKGTPEVYVNGRKVMSESELQRLTPDQIKRVEVVMNPGARYSSDVSSVIRIHTKPRQGDGFGVDERLYLWKLGRSNPSVYEILNMYYNSGKLSLEGTLYPSYTCVPDDKTLTQTTFTDNTWVQDIKVKQEYKRPNYDMRLGADFALNDDNHIGASFEGDLRLNDKSNGTMTTTISSNGTTTENSTNNYNSSYNKHDYRANVYYVGKIGDWKVNANADWVRRSAHTQDYDNEMIMAIGQPEESNLVHSRNNDFTRLWAAKVDVAHSLFGGEMSFGGEYSHSLRNADYTITPQSLGSDNKTHITEGMTSAFAEFNRNWNRLGVKVGVRYENTQFRYTLNGELQPAQSRDYNDFLPSLSLTYNTGKLQMMLGASTTIRRSPYYRMSTNINYVNHYTYESGNPTQRPAKLHSINYTVSYRQFVMSAFYIYTQNTLIMMSEPYKDSPTIILSHPVNYKAYGRCGVSLQYSTKLGWWQPQWRVFAFAQRFDMETHDPSLSLNHPRANFRWNNSFSLPFALFQLNAFVQTSGNDENAYQKAYFKLDARISKDFLNKQLSVDFEVDNLLNTAHTDVYNYYGTNLQTYYHIPNRVDFLFSLRYKFNVSRSKYRGAGAGNDAKRRM